MLSFKGNYVPMMIDMACGGESLSYNSWEVVMVGDLEPLFLDSGSMGGLPNNF